MDDSSCHGLTEHWHSTLVMVPTQQNGLYYIYLKDFGRNISRNNPTGSEVYRPMYCGHIAIRSCTTRAAGGLLQQGGL